MPENKVHNDSNIIPLTDNFTVVHRGQRGAVKYDKRLGKYTWVTMIDKRYKVTGKDTTVAEAKASIIDAIDGLLADTEDTDNVADDCKT